MSIISGEHISRSYGEKVLFDDLSFTISPKQRIGLIGVNGTGKSTLLKVIAGLESPGPGRIVHANDFRIEYLPQHPELDEQSTVVEHLYMGTSPLMNALREYDRALDALTRQPDDPSAQARFEKTRQTMDDLNGWEAMTTAGTILTRLGIPDPNQRISELSGGQRKRVAIAGILLQEADLLILDEPTNHLDHEMIEWLELYLQQYPKALLMVTHDRYVLNRVADRIWELDQGKLYTYEGNYETFLGQKAEREEQQRAGEEKRRNLLRRELAWLRRGAKARKTKQKARVQRVEALRDRKAPVQAETLEFAAGSQRLGKKVMELSDISLVLGGRCLLDGFHHLIVPGERLGIIGPNGSGKTTLLHLIAGKLEPDRGTREIGPTVRIGYYTQDPIDMDPELRVIEYIKEAAEVIRTADGQVITAEQLLERFLFSRPAQWTPIGKLSGGERRRLYLLRVLMSEPNVLLLDEPTNDLDTATLSILEEYLEQFPGVVITVSHDRYFLDRVVDRFVVMEGEGHWSRFDGNYSDYLAERKLRSPQQVQESKGGDSADQGGTAKNAADPAALTPKRKKLSYKEQQEWAEIEDRIADLERRVGELGREIELAGSDADKARDLFEEQQRVERELEEAVERWGELSLLVEALEEGGETG